MWLSLQWLNVPGGKLLALQCGFQQTRTALDFSLLWCSQTTIWVCVSLIGALILPKAPISTCTPAVLQLTHVNWLLLMVSVIYFPPLHNNSRWNRTVFPEKFVSLNLFCGNSLKQWQKCILFIFLIKFIFSLKFHTTPHKDNVNKDFKICANLLKMKNLRNHMYISIHSLCSILCWCTLGSNYSLKSFWI